MDGKYEQKGFGGIYIYLYTVSFLLNDVCVMVGYSGVIVAYFIPGIPSCAKNSVLILGVSVGAS